MITQTYDLNLIPGGQIVNVHVSQYDIGRTITFNLLNGTTPFTVPSGTTATIDGTKPDKKGFTLNASVSGGTASFSTTKNMCAVSGKTICEFRLVQGTRNIGTANFILDVERAGLADDVDMSTSELAPYIDAAKENADAARKSANDAATSENNAARSASSAETYGLMSKSYAVGGTGTRNGEDTDNSKYYAQRAMASIAAGQQVDFYIDNGYLWVVKTIDGVKQQPVSIGKIAGTTDFIFPSVAAMNAAISSGTVPNNATCYVKEDLVFADVTKY